MITEKNLLKIFFWDGEDTEICLPCNSQCVIAKLLELAKFKSVLRKRRRNLALRKNSKRLGGSFSLF